LLIASPRLDDATFAQTVVLVIDQNDEESSGLVLNRPLRLTVEQIWEEIGESPCESQQIVHAGGPLGGPLTALHTHEQFGDLRVAPGVFLAVERDSLDAVVRQQEEPFRLFAGIADWEAGELEAEIAQGDWLLLPASKVLLFAPPEDLWRRALSEYGRSFSRSIGVRHVPHEASAN
jgi:putative transcriptional regulator